MRIFVSYRREDSGYLAAALHQGLRSFGATTEVFVDTRSLGLGVDFVREVAERIARCDAVLALIGPGWRPDRLHAEHDFVRDELLAAREHGVTVVPALHSGAQPPKATYFRTRWPGWRTTTCSGSARQASSSTTSDAFIRS